MAAMTAVLMAVMMMTVVASDIKNTYKLLNQNSVEVTQSLVKCKNGTDVYVTTLAEGVLYELSTERTDFDSSVWKKRMDELDREPEDERGHVVASVFGGPAEKWNLVPQHRSVNRRILKEGSQLNRWDEFEKWVRIQLAKVGAPPVTFTIKVKYPSANGCRPVGFEIVTASKTDPGFSLSFANGPDTAFGVSSAGSRTKK